MTKPILVTGATGLQGGAVVSSLLAKGASVRAMTRNPDGKKATELTRSGVEVIYGNFDEPESLIRACDGVKSIFSVQDFHAKGVGKSGEIRQANALISAALASGAPHLVQSVMGDCESAGNVSHFLSKAEIEERIKTSGLSYTLLGTVWFMDNLMNPKMRPKDIFPVLAGSLRPDTCFYMLAIQDLGQVAALSLLNPKRFSGQKINMAGDSLTVAQMRSVYEEASGQPPKVGKIPNWLLHFFAKEFASQLRWHNRLNFNFSTQELSSLIDQPTTFRRYLELAQIEKL